MLAGAIGGSAVACGVATGPLLATAFDVAAAFATAGVAAHAATRGEGEQGAPSHVLRRAARAASKEKGAPLAAHALDVACRAWAGDARFLRSAAILLGAATLAHAPSLAFQIVGSWCAPLRQLSRLGAPVRIARGALDGAAFVRALGAAVGERPAAEMPIDDPAMDEYPLGAAEFDESYAEDQRDERQRDWEVAA